MPDQHIQKRMKTAGRSQAQASADRYDPATIALHWLTAALVVILFASAEIWDFFPRGGLRETLQNLHISLGCLLILVFVARILWRAVFAPRLPSEGPAGLADRAAHAVHGLLYLLLLAMAVTGPLKVWSRGHGVNFFWLFKIPSPFAFDRSWHGPASLIHFWAAWAIIALAGLHAVAALVHHYALKDRTLLRMMPGRGTARAL